ncbi:tetratricopeptide repeat protein [Halobacillus locisalis]|uniref:Tetratricopeptide repeat protein n=1 Tax=Halobacillus locisalis TaxID=220753 RepID=A0A838CP63_9BACI|nr:tetratricopeptide repeat protein [Halobacillus locisalis]MBA2173790.1 tetratricopeptide repeat protein [Halobacillus locisalis]
MNELDKALHIKKMGQVEEALPLFKSLIDSDATNAELHHHCGQCHDALGLEQEAVAYYENAISLDVREDLLPDTYVCLASSFNVLNRHDRALETIEEGVRQFPDYAPLKVFHSLILFSADQQADALRTSLLTLLHTTHDANIKKYERAINHYAEHLQ